MTRIARLASQGLMIPGAGVQASKAIVIAAGVSDVWAALTGVHEWERWNAHLKNATLQGPFAAGSSLTYGGFFKHHLRIAVVRKHDLVVLYGTLAGYTAITRWDVQAEGPESTRITFSESSQGLLIRQLYGADALGKHLQAWLDALKVEVEHQPQVA